MEICLTHADLDGAVSYLILNWYKKKKIPARALSQTDLPLFWKQHIVPSIEKFNKIYILDLSVGVNPSLYDYDNVTIVDHHEASLLEKSKFKRARIFIEQATSTCLLLYKTLKRLSKDLSLTKKQKLLLLGADDYDNYTLHLPFSKELNYIFWSFTGDRLQKFYEEFKEGFTGFNLQHKNIIYFYKKRIDEILASLQLYVGKFNYKNNSFKIGATFSNFAINDVADFVLNNTKADIAIVVNVKSQKVSFRKSKKCNVNLAELAEDLAGGGGHESAAGGILNERFINFTKSLLPYEFQQHSPGGNRSPI